MPKLHVTAPGIVDTPVASLARTASGNSAPNGAGGYGASSILRAQLNVTAASGTTPTLNVTIEDTIDGVNWNTVATFAQKVAAGREVLNVTTPFADRIRVSWTVAGTTPSFTFDVQIYTE